jgi:hypothetical protein
MVVFLVFKRRQFRTFCKNLLTNAFFFVLVKDKALKLPVTNICHGVG